MKILVLALSGIGDALMFTPAIKALKQVYPNCRIDALIMFRGVKDIYERNENINNVIHYEFMKEGISNSIKFLNTLRKQYDLTINVYPSNRKEYNIFNAFLMAPKRAAVKYLRKDFINLGFLNNIRTLENDSVHNVTTNLNLIKAITGKEIELEDTSLSFPLNDDDTNYANIFLSKSYITENDLVIGFHPGCALMKNHIKRRWEPEKFALLGKKLIEEKKAKILIFGGPEEEELKKNIKYMINSESVMVVKTRNLAESAAIMKRCNLFVTNDSSLMHVASAMKIKTAAIIGPTNKHYIHPWNTEHIIISLDLDCAPCFFYSPRPLICKREDVQFKCIKELSVDMVYKKLNDFAKL